MNKGLVLSMLAAVSLGLVSTAISAPKAGQETTTAATGTTDTTKCTDDTNYQLIDTAELKTVVEQKKATILDANGTKSYKKLHVPGAIDFKALKDDTQLQAKLPQDKNAMIVAYCGGPECGAWKDAAEKACEMGYTNIRHYKEGIQGWKKQKSKKS